MHGSRLACKELGIVQNCSDVIMVSVILTMFFFPMQGTLHRKQAKGNIQGAEEDEPQRLCARIHH